VSNNDQSDAHEASDDQSSEEEAFKYSDNKESEKQTE
jgi:hypothetical protein